MTAFPEERTKTRAIKAGAFGFLTKPFAQNTLLDLRPLRLARKLKAEAANLLDGVHAFNAVAARVIEQQAAPSSKHLIKINTAPPQSFCP